MTNEEKGRPERCYRNELRNQASGKWGRTRRREKINRNCYRESKKLFMKKLRNRKHTGVGQKNRLGEEVMKTKP